MFFLFGWGHQTTKDYGPTFPLQCPNCNNSSFWHLFRSRVWFTLFFIPVIPYESKHYLSCEVCSQGIELKGDQVQRAKELNQITAAFLNKEITEEQYKPTINEARFLDLPMESGTKVASLSWEKEEEKRSYLTTKKLSQSDFYCLNCGAKIEEDANFCTQCGDKINST